MSYDFGLLDLVISPFLERIGREERLTGDQLHKPRNLKCSPAKKDPGGTPSEGAQETDASLSSQHIDLRI